MYKKIAKRILSIFKTRVFTPSSIYYHLHDKPNELLMIILLEKCKDTLVSKRIEKYLTDYKKMIICLSGKDLTDLGMKPGPIYAKILKLIFYLQMNGILDNRTTAGFPKTTFSKRNYLISC